tara:strand:+ start:63 stop:1052 length:990 start_codon:yes stop_codon:yes gene_type:complete
MGRKATIFKAIVGVSILFFLLYFVGFQKIWDTLKNINLAFIPLIIILSFAQFFLGTLNIKLLTNPLVNIPFSKLFKYHTITWAAGTFIPGRIGEFGLVYFLREDGVMIGEGTAITVLDRLITIFTLGVFSTLGLFLLLTPFQAFSYLITLVLGLGVLSYIIFSKTGRRFMAKILRGYAKNFTGFSRTLFYYFRKQKKILVANLIITMGKWVLMTLLVFVLLLAFDVKANLFLVFLANVTTMIISLIPVTINGIGLKESAAILLYFRIGIPATVTLSVYLITLVIGYIQSILFLWIYFDKETRKTIIPKLKASFKRPEEEFKGKWVEIKD